MRRFAATASTFALLMLTACGAPFDRMPDASREALQQCTSSTVQGIDISDGNGSINWPDVADAGVVFAYIKATQGTYNTQSAFPTNWSGARNAGVIRGAYHFFDPTEDGVAQAQSFLGVVGTLQPNDLPPMLDVECPDGDPTCLGFSGGSGTAPAADIHQRILDFLSTVEAATGRHSVIYTYGSYFSGNGVTDTDLATYPLWIADLSSGSCFSVPASWSSAAFWQYDWTGVISGISGNVDLDRFVGTLSDLQSFANGEPFRLHHSGAADVDGDGRADVCGRGPDGIICYLSIDGGLGPAINGPALSDDAGWNEPQYASTIQFADVTGDGLSDLCARGANGVQCWPSNGNGFDAPLSGPAWTDADGWNLPLYGATIQLADIDGDGKADICGRSSTGIECWLASGSGFPTQVIGPSISDSADWGSPQYYSTIRFADIDGDGKADVCGRAKAGIVCWRSLGNAFDTTILSGPAWSDANGWDSPTYYQSIQFADVNGDGKSDVCGRGPNGVECWLSNGNGFPTQVTGPSWSDAAGWNQPGYGSTVQFADIDGDGKADVCGRAANGVICYLSDGTAFPTQITGPDLSDAVGWDTLPYYWTIELADVTGDGKADLCARAAAGYHCWPSLGSSFATSFATTDYSDASGWIAPAYFATVSLIGGQPAHVVSTTTGSSSSSSGTTSTTATTGTGTGTSTSTSTSTSTTGTHGTTSVGTSGTHGTTGSTGSSGTVGTSTSTTGSTLTTNSTSSGSTNGSSTPGTKSHCGCTTGGDGLVGLLAAVLALFPRRRRSTRSSTPWV
jgi:MYXO-CTERM domain-containing protein